MRSALPIALMVSALAPACAQGEDDVPAVGPAPATESAPTPAPAPAPTPAPAPAPAPQSPAACGDSPLPPCPLRAWMKANAAPAIRAGDPDALAAVLDKIATFAPAGYPNWASIAEDGAAAARALSLDAVKAACRGCHRQYKDRYKREMRGRPL